MFKSLYDKIHSQNTNNPNLQADLIQYKYLKRLIKGWQQNAGSSLSVNPSHSLQIITEHPITDNMAGLQAKSSQEKLPKLSGSEDIDNLTSDQLKSELARVKLLLAQMKQTFALRLKEGNVVHKHEKTELKNLYEWYCLLKEQHQATASAIHKSQDQIDQSRFIRLMRLNDLKARKRELQEQLHEYQKRFMAVNGYPVHTTKDMEPMKSEYKEYKVNYDNKILRNEIEELEQQNQ